MRRTDDHCAGIFSHRIALFIFVRCAIAQHQTFILDADASEVAFALNGSGHHVEGKFHVQSGSVDFDPAAPGIAGTVVVAAGNGQRATATAASRAATRK
jgi:hypothetical protein